MPRREVLTPSERVRIVGLPEDPAELVRLSTLSDDDLAFIAQHRGEHNRLGIAAQLVYLRFPGRVLGPAETPDPTVLELLASQLGCSREVWSDYALRDQTRREHLQEVLDRLGLAAFSGRDYRELIAWLAPIALRTTDGWSLATAVAQELRIRKVLLPVPKAIDRLCAEALTRAQREIYRRLLAPLSTEQRSALDGLIKPRDHSPISTLAWLRTPVADPSPSTILDHIRRLEVIRSLGLPPNLGRDIPSGRLERLAREGGQAAAYLFSDLSLDRRHATLVAVLLDLQATITDEILSLNERLIGSFFTKAKNRYARTFAESGKAINDKVHLFAEIGAALISAKARGGDPWAAIESVLPWPEFLSRVGEAGQLARRPDFDSLELLTEFQRPLGRYLPKLLETLEFKGAPVAAELLAGVDAVRRGFATHVLDADSVPTAFIRERWRSFVFPDGDLDAAYYEFCVAAELKNSLRAGDVWVVGSRQFRDFADYLMPKEVFSQRLADNRLSVAVAAEPEKYLADRIAQVEEALDATERLAAAGELPEAEVDETGLHISPVHDDTPSEARALRLRASALLPRVKITDLLLEVDQWVGFTRHFAHLKNGEPPRDSSILLAAVLGDAINLGLGKMAEVSPGMTAAKLAWLVAWHVRDETYARALAELVNFQQAQPFAGLWGAGTTSSSDGQRFRAGGRGEAAAHVNARYGSEPGVIFYTHVSDQHAPFHTKVINVAVRDATHVLDGLLYHESDLRIEEHYTDTAGFTDHVFGLCHLLGFRFAPRIRDINDRRLYVPGRRHRWPTLEPTIGGTLNINLVRQQFHEVLRLAESIRQGTATASLLLRKLGAYPRQNHLALALREIGRVERTLFMLDWMRDPSLRRRVHHGLTKGEARNSLARAVFFHRLGEIRDRSFENQSHRASGLNLVVAAIIVWNTVYLARVVDALRQRETIDESLLAHLSPLGWEHISLTGDYLWHTDRSVARGGFRPLRHGADASHAA